MAITHRFYDLKQGLEFLDKCGSLTYKEIEQVIPRFTFYRLLIEGYIQQKGAMFYSLTEKGRKEADRLPHEFQVESFEELLSINFETGQIHGKMKETEVAHFVKKIKEGLENIKDIASNIAKEEGRDKPNEIDYRRAFEKLEE